MQKNQILIEAVARIDENAKIRGVALIPRISRNNNLYTKDNINKKIFNKINF